MTSAANNIHSGMPSTQLNLLMVLPYQDRHSIFNMLNYTEIMRLSACSHSLREIIRDDNILWRRLYKQDFLSSGYRKEEWEFIFWCVRTDPNTKIIPTRRADVIKSVDWYNTYRRRITTENNWRYGYSNATEIDTEWDDIYGNKKEYKYRSTLATSIILKRSNYEIDVWKHSYYHVDYPAYSNLKHSNNKTQHYSFYTLPKNSLYGNSASNSDYIFMTSYMGDYYVAGVKRNQEETCKTMVIALYNNEDETKNVTINISLDAVVRMVDGKWALVCDKSDEDSYKYCMYNLDS
jgi:hypothetical protein